MRIAIFLTFLLTFSLGCKSQKEPIDHTIQKISFKNRNAELHGIIAIPKGDGPFPGIVYVHGAGPEKRHEFYANYFASQGFIFLTFDKRSYGESTGEFFPGSNTSYENLELKASDICAAINLLKERNDVDKSQLGLYGASQAGWIAPISVSMDSDISFIAIFSAGVVTTGEEYDYSELSGENPEFFEKYTKEQIKEMELNLTKYGYDPNPVLESINVRALWLFGDRDESIPITLSVQNLEKIKNDFQKDYTIEVFENRDHSLRLPNEKYGPPDFIHEMIVDWIRNIE
jgi:uncharacterized protein